MRRSNRAWCHGQRTVSLPSTFNQRPRSVDSPHRKNRHPALAASTASPKACPKSIPPSATLSRSQPFSKSGPSSFSAFSAIRIRWLHHHTIALQRRGAFIESFPESGEYNRVSQQILTELRSVAAMAAMARAELSFSAAKVVTAFAQLRRGRQLLFDLRQNAFHLFFAEGAHGLGLDVSQ